MSDLGKGVEQPTRDEHKNVQVDIAGVDQQDNTTINHEIQFNEQPTLQTVSSTRVKRFRRPRQRKII